MIIGYVLDDTLDKSDGVQQAMISIAEKMRQLGHDVHYIVPICDRTDLSQVHRVGKIMSLKFNGNSIRTPIWSSKKKIKKLFLEVKFDVLHIQMPYSPLMAARVMRMAPSNTRLVGTFHILPYNLMARVGTKLLGFVLSATNNKLSAAFAVSEPALEFMKHNFGVNGKVLGNPVRYSFFNKYSKQKQNNTKIRMVFVGRFDERKGVRELISAYEQMKNRDNVDLIMCGKGPLWGEVNSINESKKLGVKLTGFVSEEEKAEYLSSADIAVFPSISGESFGIVLTEAMSAGSGVTLGGNNPGYASVLGAWPETLFNPKNINEFASFLDDWVVDTGRRKLIGSQQHQDVKQYDIDVIVDRLIREAYN